MRTLLLLVAMTSFGSLMAQTNLNPTGAPTFKASEAAPNFKTYTTCGYLQESNAFEDGRISQTGWPLVCAEDFVVTASECWDITDITVNYLVNSPSDDIQIFFYSNNGGVPGAVIATEVISFGNCALTLLGNNWGLDVYEYAFSLQTPVNICGGVSGTTYWFSVQAISNNNHYWEFTNLPTYGSNGMSAGSPSGPWTQEGDNYVFELFKGISHDTTVVQCAPYSIQVGGNTYDSTGVYTETLTSVFGCDSIVNLDLTIIDPSTGTDVQSSCGDYTWIDNNTYSTDTMATYTIANGAANGCDSVVTLDLTITPGPDVSMTINGATLTVTDSTGTYQWIDCDNNNVAIGGATSQTFIPPSTGNYAVIVTSSGGCVDTSLCYLADYTSIDELLNKEKVLIKIVDFSGRETQFKANTPLIFIYSDGTRERVMLMGEE